MRLFDQNTTGRREASLLEALHKLHDQWLQQPEQRNAVLEQMEACLPTFPLKIQIQTTTRCNAACQMCPYPEVTSQAEFEHQIMSETLFDSLIEQLRNQPVERVSLFLMNEPLLDVRLGDWLSKAKSALPQVQLSLFTNGSALTGVKALQLAKSGLDELTISVHGFDRTTYETVMKGLSFNRLQRNLEEVFTLYRAKELEPLKIHLVTGDIPELTNERELANPLYRQEILLKAFSNEREAVGLTTQIGSSKPQDAATRWSLCQRPLVKMYILANGQCVLCNVDWSRDIILGQIDAKHTIADVWNNQAYGQLRRQHLTQSFSPDLLCRRCDYAHVIDTE